MWDVVDCPPKLHTPPPSLLCPSSSPDCQAKMVMDATLMTVVNVMGVCGFGLVVAFHFLTATPKDVDA